MPEFTPKNHDANPFELTKSYAEISTEEGNIGVIYLYDTIRMEPWWGFSPNTFRELVGYLGDVDEYRLRILSPGGSTVAAFAIVTEIKRLIGKGKTIVSEVESAASAATVVALACSDVKISATGWWMIHPARSDDGLTTVADKTKAISRLEKIDEQMLALYAKASGLDEAEIQQLMDDETYLTGSEAIERGFCSAALDFETDATEAIANASRSDSESSATRQAFLDSVCAEVVSNRRKAAKKGGDPVAETELKSNPCATLEDIESIAPEASAEWQLGQIKSKHTIEQVTDAWRAEEKRQMDEMRAENVQLKKDLAAKSPDAKDGDDDDGPLGQGRPQSGGTPSGDPEAITNWETEQKRLVDGGMTKAEATRQMVKEAPEMHDAYREAIAKKFQPKRRR